MSNGDLQILPKKLKLLNKWAGFLYSPLMEDKVQKIQESDSGGIWSTNCI